MSEYRFAQLFVRISRILGVLVLICGIGLTGLNFLALRSDYDAAAYIQNKSLGKLLNELTETKNRTLRILREKRLMDSKSYFSNPIPDLAPSNPKEFEGLEISLSAWTSDTNKLKASLLDDFEESVETIRNKLLKFADSLKGESPRRDKETRQVNPPSQESLVNHIFDEDSRNTFPSRISIMEDAKGFLQMLQDESNQDESKKTLARAIDEIETLINLIPAEMSSPVSISPEISEDERAEEATLRAERVAELLEETISNMRIVVYERWAIQTSLSQASEMTNLEKREMENAKKLRRAILIQGAGTMLGLILGSFLATFFIFVISDFLQTQLDIAGNTSILAGNR